MPSTYAHERFGNLVYDHLPENLQEKISEEQDLYHIGLQGPDILFYCDPFGINGTAEAGRLMHKMSGRMFFARETDLLERQNGSIREAGEVYMYGMLCHYVLDSACHGFINRYARELGVSHGVIEGEFDRSLIAEEGRVPVEEDMTANFHPSKRSDEVISIFYPAQGLKIISKSTKRFKFFHRVLRCPGSLKRNFLYTGLKVIKQYDALRGHITSEKPVPECAESCLHLRKILVESVPEAVRLIKVFPDIPDEERFDLTFGGEKEAL